MIKKLTHHQISVNTRKKMEKTFKKYGFLDSWISRETDPMNKIAGYKLYKEGKAKKTWPNNIQLGKNNLYLTIKVASSQDNNFKDPNNWRYTQDVMFELINYNGFKTYVVKEFGNSITLYFREIPNKLYPHSCGCIHWEHGIKGNIWDNYCKHNWAAFYSAIDELDKYIDFTKKDFKVLKNARLWKNENNEEAVVELYNITENMLKLYDRLQNSSLTAYEKTDIMLAYLTGCYPEEIWDLGKNFKQNIKYILESKTSYEINQKLNKKITSKNL